MGKKQIITAMPALLLVFGLLIVSCGGGTPNLPPTLIPGALTGSYTFSDGHELIIRANGTGTLDGEDCTFSEADGVLTVTMGGETITVDWTADVDGYIIFSNLQGDSETDLFEIFEEIVSADPVKPGPIEGGGAEPGIPEALVGAWGNAMGWTVVLDGGVFVEDEPHLYDVVIVIGADGSGKAVNPWSLLWTAGVPGLDDCTWSVNENKLTMNTATQTCIFDWVINAGDGKLHLSNPVPGSEEFSYALAIYAEWEDLEKIDDVELPPEIDDFTWTSAIPSEYRGTWATLSATFPSRRVFAIKADGSGYVYRSTVPGFGECTYQFSAGSGTESDKLLLAIDGVGRCAYECSINEDDELELSSLVYDGTSGNILSAYASLFSPMEKVSASTELPFDIPVTDFLFVTPDEYTGTWNIFSDIPIFVINADLTGTVVMTGFDDPLDCFIVFTADETKMLLTIPDLGGRCLFDCSLTEDEGVYTLTLSNANPDAGGEFLVAYANPLQYLGTYTKGE